jgi:hypothetical protein
MAGLACVAQGIEIFGSDTRRCAELNEIERSLKVRDCQGQAHLAVTATGSAVAESNLVAQLRICGLLNVPRFELADCLLAAMGGAQLGSERFGDGFVISHVPS